MPELTKLVNISHNQVSVVIGENGSGKSTLLNKLTKGYLSQGRDVIAIANSIHDKFTSRSKRFNLLGHRSGRKVSQKVIKKALVNIDNEDLVKTKRIGQILEYVGYDGEIGFQVTFKKDILKYELEESEFISPMEREDISSLISKLYHNEINGTHWVRLDEFKFNKMNSSTVTRLLRHEKTLRKLEVIDEVKVFLKKHNEEINLSDASSGELSFITSLIFISTVISDYAVIVIDEPENSLHPRWQREYISKLMDIFYYHQPSVICATHSPIIVSGAEISESQLSVFKSQDSELNELTLNSNNLEQLLWEMFGIATPENRYLSNLIMSTLNKLAENEIDLMEVNQVISLLENSVYDNKQRSLLSSVKQLAIKIQARKSNNASI